MTWTTAYLIIYTNGIGKHMKRIEILKRLEELDAENKKDYELFRKLTEKEDNETIHYEFTNGFLINCLKEKVEL